MKRPKILPKYLAWEEIIALLDAAKKTRYRDFVLLLTLTRTGMRVSDVVHFRKGDIINDTIVVRKGKGKKDRVIPLESELNNILGLYVDRMKPKQRVFPITERQVRNVLYKYRPDLHPHILRHSFAVHCLKSGMNLRTLQKILGHSVINTTQIYLDVSGEDIKEDFRKVKFAF